MTSKAFFLNIKKMWLINFALINFISQQNTVHRENPPNKNMISEKINDIYLWRIAIKLYKVVAVA